MAVRAMTGIAAVAGSAFSSCVAASPSMPGNWMSMRMSSGRSDRATARPASASIALSTEWPALASSMLASFMFAALSSMMRIRAMQSSLARGERAADLGDEDLAVEARLGDDRDGDPRRRAQRGDIVLGDLLGRHDQDRNGRGLGRFLECLHHVEPVHVRHHE